MRTIAKKLLPLLFVTFILAVVFPLWSQESEPEEKPDEPTTTTEETKAAEETKAQKKPQPTLL